MASTTNHLLLFLTILLGIFSISATARPCKAFFISTYSFTIKPQNPNPNPNPNPNHSGSLTIYTTEFEIFLDRRLPLDHELQIQHHQQQNQHHQHQHQHQQQPFGFSSYDMSSLRDRTKDILSVVVALLFGVGCGAFAAATLYLVWTLFANRYSYDEFEIDDDDEKEKDADFSPKKMGYVKIPAAEK